MKINRYLLAGILGLTILLGLVSLFPRESNPGMIAHVHAAGNSTVPVFLPLVVKPSGPASISIVNFAYNPQVITVTVGTQVTWTNNETLLIQHTVTSGAPFAPDGKFDSGTLMPGQSSQFTFTSPGTFAYYCRIHLSAMTGTIIVVP